MGGSIWGNNQHNAGNSQHMGASIWEPVYGSVYMGASIWELRYGATVNTRSTQRSTHGQHTVNTTVNTIDFLHFYNEILKKLCRRLNNICIYIYIYMYLFLFTYSFIRLCN